MENNFNEFGPQTLNLQKFFIRNLLPDISGVLNFEGSENKLLENVFAITNFESLEELKTSNTSDLLSSSFNLSKLLESNSNIFFLSPDPYFTNIKFNFKIEKSVSYEQIFDAGKYLGLLKDPLINYALVAGGDAAKTQITNFFDKLIEITTEKTKEAQIQQQEAKTSEKKEAASRQELLWGGFSEALKSFSPIVAGATGGITDFIQNILNFGLDLLSPGEANKKIFRFAGEADSFSRREIRNSFKSITLSSFFTAKMFSEVQSPFPKVTLTITNVAKKSIDEHIPLINFITKLITPLTIAAPIFPIQIIIFNDHKGKEAFGKNKEAHPMVQFQNGLNPFTYTQSNVGYFNVTGISIEGYERSPYGTTDSVFYQKSGIPLPMVLKVTLTLEAFDPFYFNYFDPSALFKAGSGLTVENEIKNNKTEETLIEVKVFYEKRFYKDMVEDKIDNIKIFRSISEIYKSGKEIRTFNKLIKILENPNLNTMEIDTFIENDFKIIEKKYTAPGISVKYFVLSFYDVKDKK